MPSEHASHWSLDPAVTYLNHGSFGACPTAVLAAQAALRAELEREPVDFLVRTFQRRLDEARGALSAFVGADAADLAFVPNATTGVNVVLRSLPFGPGEELLTTSHVYNACRLTLEHVARTTGARLVMAPLPFPLTDPSEVVDAVFGAVTPRTRLALLDHVTSPTALVLPLKQLVEGLADRGVDTLVDGAHAPGMVPLDLQALGAAYYTGNAHKWLCAPKGSAFLHVRRDRQAGLHPGTLSHGYGTGFHGEFDWTGTCDPTPWLCIPEALRVVGGMHPEGWPGVMAANRALALAGRDLLATALGVPLPAPEAMIGSLASLPLPPPEPGSPLAEVGATGLADWCRARGMETWAYSHPVPLVRLSAQRYNDLDQVARLADLLREALRGR